MSDRVRRTGMRVGVLLLVVLGCLPPWCYRIPDGTQQDCVLAGYAPIWRAPKPLIRVRRFSTFADTARAAQAVRAELLGKTRQQVAEMAEDPLGIEQRVPPKIDLSNLPDQPTAATAPKIDLSGVPDAPQQTAPAADLLQQYGPEIDYSRLLLELMIVIVGIGVLFTTAEKEPRRGPSEK